MTHIPFLETERLMLRAHALEDFEAYADMWADPDVVRYISGTPSSRSESWARMLRNVGMWRVLGYGYWAVEQKGGGFIGEVGLADFRRDSSPDISGMPEVGWVFAQHGQGQGFAHEAVRAALDWADENLPAPETACLIAPDHQASIRLANAVGFQGFAEGSLKGEPALFSEDSAALDLERLAMPSRRPET